MPGDQARLHQILANLLANARTHTPAGHHGRHPACGPRARLVRVSVTDDGPGVPGRPAAHGVRAVHPRRRLPRPRERLDRARAEHRRRRGPGPRWPRRGVEPAGSDDVLGAPPRHLTSLALSAEVVARAATSAPNAREGGLEEEDVGDERTCGAGDQSRSGQPREAQPLVEPVRGVHRRRRREHDRGVPPLAGDRDGVPGQRLPDALPRSPPERPRGNGSRPRPPAPPRPAPSRSRRRSPCRARPARRRRRPTARPRRRGARRR